MTNAKCIICYKNQTESEIEVNLGETYISAPVCPVCRAAMENNGDMNPNTPHLGTFISLRYTADDFGADQRLVYDAIMNASDPQQALMRLFQTATKQPPGMEDMGMMIEGPDGEVYPIDGSDLSGGAMYMGGGVLAMSGDDLKKMLNIPGLSDPAAGMMGPVNIPKCPGSSGLDIDDEDDDEMPDEEAVKFMESMQEMADDMVRIQEVTGENNEFNKMDASKLPEGSIYRNAEELENGKTVVEPPSLSPETVLTMGALDKHCDKCGTVCADFLRGITGCSWCKINFADSLATYAEAVKEHDATEDERIQSGYEDETIRLLRDQQRMAAESGDYERAREIKERIKKLFNK